MDRNQLQGYAFAILVLGLATLVRFLLDPWLGDYVPFPTYFASVAIVGIYGRLGPAMFTLVIGGLTADVLFMPPRGQLVLSTPEHWFGLCLFFFNSLVIVVLAESLRRNRVRLREGTAKLEAQTLYLQEADQRKDEFLSMLAHELRNPLAPIVSAVEVLRMTGKDRDDQAQSAVDIIDRQAKHLTYLVDDLLDLVRVNTGRITLKREPTDIGDVIRQAAESAELRCRTKGVSFAVTPHAGKLWANADRGRLVQVLANLLDNACKFTDAGGSVVLIAQRTGDECVLTVRDTGIGIDSKHLSRIFDVFEQVDSSLDREAVGLGLGLHLVQRLVEKHGGTVSAHSEGAGRGCEFVVRLPLDDDHAPRIPRPGRRANALEPRRMLIVDDNVDAANAMQLILTAEGHDVHVCNSGHDGLELADMLQPELVLVDLRMPDMDGYSTARHLRDRLGDDVRLIAVTGFSHDDYRARSEEAGFDAHVVKPTTIDVLNEAIKEAMDGA